MSRNQTRLSALLLSLWVGILQAPPALAQFSGDSLQRTPGRESTGDTYPNPAPGRFPFRPGGSWRLNFPLLTPRPRPQPPTAATPREQFEDRFQQADPETAVQLFETLQIREYEQAFDLQFRRLLPRASEISRTLSQRAQETGQRGAMVQIVVLADQVHLLMVPPQPQPLAQSQPMRIASSHLTPGLFAQTQQTETPPVIRHVLESVGQQELQQVVRQFRQEVSNPARVHTHSYRPAAQQLYQWLIAPLEPYLQAHEIDTILFSMDDGLRTTPMAALHDGEQFLIQKYSVALLPSFGWTDTRKIDLTLRPVLAMGISEGVNGLAPLPAVSVELSTVTEQLWRGRGTTALNEAATLDNLRALNRQNHFGIIHLATHAELLPGAIDNSFIQFWDARLTLRQLRQLSQDLEWGTIPSVELLVLSACDTALGSKDAELGFAGSALNAGVRSTVASLWAINDRATLGLMSQFYHYLRTAPTKAEAMRQSQLAMLSGEVQLVDNQLRIAANQSIQLPPTLVSQQPVRLTHPYFWSGYTVIGNWN